MKIKILIGILVFLIVINLATIGSFVYLQWRQPPRDFPPLEQGPPFELNLDRSQRQKLRTLLLDFKEETQDIHSQVRDLEDEVLQLLQEETASSGAIDEKLEKIAELRLEINKKIVEKFYETREFLSPAQQKRFYNSLTRGRPGPMGPGNRFRGERPGPPPGNRQFKERSPGEPPFDQ